MKNTSVMYVDVGGQDEETSSNNYRLLDHVNEEWGQTPSVLLCTHGPFLTRGLPEDLKLI